MVFSKVSTISSFFDSFSNWQWLQKYLHLINWGISTWTVNFAMSSFRILIVFYHLQLRNKFHIFYYLNSSSWITFCFSIQLPSVTSPLFCTWIFLYLVFYDLQLRNKFHIFLLFCSYLHLILWNPWGRLLTKCDNEHVINIVLLMNCYL